MDRKLLGPRQWNETLIERHLWEAQMNTPYSRRSFFALSRSALASVGLASWITPLNAAATPTPTLDDGVDYYDKLGVPKIINAAGVFTMFTSSIMPPPVQLVSPKQPGILCD
jgi:hypothetical protein